MLAPRQAGPFWVVQFGKEASQTRDYCVAKGTRRFAWLAQIPFGFAQGRLSLRKNACSRMTTCTTSPFRDYFTNGFRMLMSKSGPSARSRWGYFSPPL